MFSDQRLKQPFEHPSAMISYEIIRNEMDTFGLNAHHIGFFVVKSVHLKKFIAFKLNQFRGYTLSRTFSLLLTHESVGDLINRFVGKCCLMCLF